MIPAYDESRRLLEQAQRFITKLEKCMPRWGAGFRICEFPVTWDHRGGSRIGLRTGMAALLQVVEIPRYALLERDDAALDRVHQPT